MTARIVGRVTREEAKLNPPKSRKSMVPGKVQGVALHHGASATPTNHSGCISSWRAYQRLHMVDRGWKDIAYSMGVCNHGYAFDGRGAGIEVGSNGGPSSNTTYYSICFIGDGRDANELAKNAFEWCIQHLRTQGGAGKRVRPHSDFESTSCPLDVIRNFARSLDNKDLTTVTQEDTVLTSTLRRGDTGPQVALLQKMLNSLRSSGIDVDGKFGPATEGAVIAASQAWGISAPHDVVGPGFRAKINELWTAYNAKPSTPPPSYEPPTNVGSDKPSLTPEQEIWRKNATGASIFKDRTAEDPETAPRIPLGRTLENLTDLVLSLHEKVDALQKEIRP